MQIQMSLGPLSLVLTYPDDIDPLRAAEGFRLMVQNTENKVLQDEWLAAYGYLISEGNQSHLSCKHT